VDLAPTYRAPPPPVPAGVAPQSAAPAEDGRAMLAWRDFFLDPQLKAVIAQALDNNRDVRVAVANVAAARAQYGLRRAALAPSLSANLSADYGQTPLSVVNGGAAGGSAGGVYNERLYNANGAVSAWQLDLFGKIRNTARAALESYFATRETRDAAQVTLIGEVAADWLALGADRALLATARDTQASGEESLALVQARYDHGAATALDLAQAQTVVEQARYDQAHLTTVVAQDLDALRLVVGASPADSDLPRDVGAPTAVLADLPANLSSKILLTRPDVLAAEAQLRSANANIGVARAAFFPDISLTGSGGVTSLALSTLFRSASETWSFAPTISEPIFDAGANRSNLAYAKAQRDVALATYEKAVQTAFREVADGLAERATIDAQLAAQTALVEASDRAYRIADARYRAGSDTYLNALIAQRSLNAARQSLIATRLAKAGNLVSLYAALGGGLN
jgi:multidrug efflux system outer membrane protein